MGPERRRSPRVEILGRIHGQIVSMDVPVTIREISLGGMGLETGVPFPEGSVYAFSLRLGDGSTVHLRGRVVRCREERSPDGDTVYASGVQFLEDEPPDADGTVGALIDQIK